jgi:hypothetical protein
MSIQAIRSVDFDYQGRKLTVFAIKDGIADLWRVDVRDGTQRVVAEVIEITPETVFDAHVTGQSQDFIADWMDHMKSNVEAGTYKVSASPIARPR